MDDINFSPSTLEEAKETIRQLMAIIIRDHVLLDLPRHADPEALRRADIFKDAICVQPIIKGADDQIMRVFEEAIEN